MTRSDDIAAKNAKIAAAWGPQSGLAGNIGAGGILDLTPEPITVAGPGPWIPKPPGISLCQALVVGGTSASLRFEEGNMEDVPLPPGDPETVLAGASSLGSTFFNGGGFFRINVLDIVGGASVTATAGWRKTA